ncbi:MAG: RNA polymerase factor sigma-54 [Candidatus Mucispirillum faecigallinarum]|nr:RNA polymerase factor sigma-54 [Candidatus Mucispirillum faecigallinarum]
MNNINQNLDIKNTLQTTVFITPQMKQSLAILQMPIVELEQELSNILEENPILEVSEDGGSDDFESLDDFDENNETSIEDNEDNQDNEKNLESLVEKVTGDDWEEYIGYEKLDDISYKSTNDENNFDLEQVIGAKESLYEHLMYQLNVNVVDKEERRIGEYIIGNLSEDGYFRIDEDTACDELNVDKELFEKVLDIIKTFTPSGIASSSLTECIITQIKDMGCEEVYIDLVEELLSGYSAELAAFKYDDILKGMSIERDTFDYLLELIKKTDPRPGLNFSGSDTKFVTPDVFIVPNEENFDIIVNEKGIPNIRLNNYYIKMLQGSNLDSEAKSYIKDKVKNAVWVIESLQKRQKAIYKVVKAIAEFQGDFLQHGISMLKPLKLKDIAEATGLHESTVSRVTSGKYAMTKHGLIELKSFFSKSLESQDGDMSIGVIKQKIKELIDEEDKTVCLSDQRIVELMEEKGIKIARRTVAKYRDEMNIPTMSQRRRLRR